MKILAKILDFIASIILIIRDFIWKGLILIFFARDPCKKCIIRPCCSERCEEKVYYLNFCDIEGKIIFRRFCAASIIFSCMCLCWVVYNKLFS